ncbi:MAG: squalene/phytoene synthase family protein [Parvularculaceae bacterium]|nr:squalene/phytoene synthase family protein [Parvularculaceae bacterium]
MTDVAPGKAPFDRALIAEADEDLNLSLNYAAPEDRARLAALFAFLIELRRIPSSVSEAPLGEIRLQWHREALDEIVASKRPRAHPVVTALAGAVDVASARPILETLIDARARLLYEPRFTTLGDLRAFLAAAEAPLAVLALGSADTARMGAAQGLAEAHALARLAPALAPAIAEEAAAAALDLHARHAPALAGLSAGAFGRIAYLALTRGHAARPAGEAWPVMKRLALLRAVASGRF